MISSLVYVLYSAAHGVVTLTTFFIWVLGELFRFFPRYILLERVSSKSKLLGKRGAAELGFAFSGPGQAIALSLTSIEHDVGIASSTPRRTAVSAAFLPLRGKPPVTGFVPPIYAVYPKLQILLLLLAPIRRIARSIRSGQHKLMQNSAAAAARNFDPIHRLGQEDLGSSSSSSLGIYWVGGRRPVSGSSRTSVVLLLCPSNMHGGAQGVVASRFGALCEAVTAFGAHNSTQNATLQRSRSGPDGGRGGSAPRMPTTPLNVAGGGSARRSSIAATHLSSSQSGVGGGTSSLSASFRRGASINDQWNPSAHSLHRFSAADIETLGNNNNNNKDEADEKMEARRMRLDVMECAEWFCACPQNGPDAAPGGGESVDVDAIMKYLAAQYGSRGSSQSEGDLLVFAVGYAEGANAFFEYAVRKGRDSMLDGVICVSHGFCWEQHRAESHRDRLLSLASKVAIIADGLEASAPSTPHHQPSASAVDPKSSAIEVLGTSSPPHAEVEREPSSPSTAALFVSAQRSATERLSQWANATASERILLKRRALARSPSNANWDEIIYGSSIETATIRGGETSAVRDVCSVASPTRYKLREDVTPAATSNLSSSPPLISPADIASRTQLARKTSFQEPLPWGAAQQKDAPLASSSVQQRLALQYRCANNSDLLNEIYTPTLIVHSRDDHVVPFAKLPREAFSRNPHIFVCATRRGGHACFLESVSQVLGAEPTISGDGSHVIGASWLETLVFEFCAAVSEHR